MSDHSPGGGVKETSILEEGIARRVAQIALQLGFQASVLFLSSGWIDCL